MTGPIRLVVVADDGAVDLPRNEGILHAWRHGMVGAVSVLANGSGLAHLAAAIGEIRPGEDPPPPGIGLHLNLTEGRALAGPLPGLTDDAGRFLHDKRDLWRLALEDAVDPAVVEREARAQIRRLHAAGLVPSHADGHQHVHLLPGVREGYAAALDDVPTIRCVRAVPAVTEPPEADARSAWPRLPRDRLSSAHRASDARGYHAQAALATLAAEAGDLLRNRTTADVFVGPGLLAGAEEEDVLRRLAIAVGTAPPGGVVEWMTHPGSCMEDGVPFSGCVDRERERDLLSDAGFLARVRALGLQPGGFPGAGDGP